MTQPQKAQHECYYCWGNHLESECPQRAKEIPESTIQETRKSVDSLGEMLSDFAKDWCFGPNRKEKFNPAQDEPERWANEAYHADLSTTIGEEESNEI